MEIRGSELLGMMSSDRRADDEASGYSRQYCCDWEPQWCCCVFLLLPHAEAPTFVFFPFLICFCSTLYHNLFFFGFFPVSSLLLVCFTSISLLSLSLSLSFVCSCFPLLLSLLFSSISPLFVHLSSLCSISLLPFSPLWFTLFLLFSFSLYPYFFKQFFSLFPVLSFSLLFFLFSFSFLYLCLSPLFCYSLPLVFIGEKRRGGGY